MYVPVLSLISAHLQPYINYIFEINLNVFTELYKDSPDYPKLAKLINESGADIILTFPHVLDNLVQHGLCCDSIKWFQSTSAGRIDTSTCQNHKTISDPQLCLINPNLYPDFFLFVR